MNRSVRRIISFPLALMLTCLASSSPVHAQVLKQDSLVLVAIYNNTEGADWTNKINWLNGPVGTWQGVMVSDGRVSELHFHNNNLSGVIPPVLGNLSQLQFLDLSYNQLSGVIPPELSGLTQLLVLQLHGNQLTGAIPAELGNLHQLQYMCLFGNQLTGVIPPELGNLTRLQQLILFSNQLTGAIPPELGNLTELLYLNLYDNQLSGPIPPELGNLSKLSVLSLFRNRLTGTIPSALGNLTHLECLYLSGNSLTGSIPVELGNLSTLEELFLNENLLTGTVPPELGNLKNLNSLGLHINQLIGAIPTEIRNLTGIRYLCLHRNQLSDLPNLDTLAVLEKLWVYSNRFTFEDIEPNISDRYTEFIYAPQDSVGTEADTIVAAGDSLLLFVTVGGIANRYQWMKDGFDILGAVGDTMLLGPVNPSDSGAYVCRITNTIATALTIYSLPINIWVEGQHAVVNQPTLPTKYCLHPAYPNPFNPSTTLRFDLPEAAEVSLLIYDLLGREVARLVTGQLEAGYHSVSWDGRDTEGRSVPTGLYIARMVTPAYTHSSKLVLLK